MGTPPPNPQTPPSSKLTAIWCFCAAVGFVLGLAIFARSHESPTNSPQLSSPKSNSVASYGGQTGSVSTFQSDRPVRDWRKTSPVPEKPASSTAVSADSGRYYDYDYRPAVGEHYVSGYHRRDGTYVRGHYRTNPDDSFWNNWSSQGNVNPHTGRVGNKRPPTGLKPLQPLKGLKPLRALGR